MWSVVVLGSEFILLLFIEIMAADCWSEIEVVSSMKSIGDTWFGLLPRGWLLFRGVVLLYNHRLILVE